MTAIEDRLRSEMPQLADQLRVTPDLSRSESGPDDNDIERVSFGPSRRWLWAAASVVAIAGLSAVAVANQKWRSDAESDGGEIAIDAVAEPADQTSQATRSEPAVQTPDTDNRDQRRVEPATEAGGRWEVVAEAPIRSRSYPVAAWTGDDFVFWAGSSLDRKFAYSDGARYDPATDSWSGLATPGWGHPGLTGTLVGDQIYAAAKGGLTAINVDTGEFVEVVAPTEFALTHVISGGGYLWGAGRIGDDLGIGQLDPVDNIWTIYPPLVDGWVAFVGDQTAEAWEEGIHWANGRIVVWSRSGTGYTLDTVEDRWDEIILPAPPVDKNLGGDATPSSLISSRAVGTDLGLAVVAQFDVNGITLIFAGVDNGLDGFQWFTDPIAKDALDRIALANAGQHLMILRSYGSPTTVDLVTGEQVVHHESPIGARSGAATVWTGRQLMIWGGESPDDVDQPLVGALWTPPKP